MENVIPLEEVSFDREIGTGSYGKVYRGSYKGEIIAVKVCHHIHRIIAYVYSWTHSKLIIVRKMWTYSSSMCFTHLVMLVCSLSSSDRQAVVSATQSLPQTRDPHLVQNLSPPYPRFRRHLKGTVTFLRTIIMKQQHQAFLGWMVVCDDGV